MVRATDLLCPVQEPDAERDVVAELHAVVVVAVAAEVFAQTVAVAFVDALVVFVATP